MKTIDMVLTSNQVQRNPHAAVVRRPRGTCSMYALTAAAAIAFFAVPQARAADCPDGVNPAGSTCDTDAQLKTLDNLVPTNAYTNNGTFNATQADGVKLDGTTSVFTNNGTYNVKALGALNFNAAGATFNNTGIFNNAIDGGMVFNADGTVMNTGVFNNLVANGITSNGNLVTFNNNIGGVFNSFGGTIDIGTTGMFTNAGTLNLGAGSTIGTTTITGNYDQTSTGALKLRTDWGNTTTDSLTVTGNATLAGIVVVNHTNVTGGSLTKTVIIVNSTGGVTAPNLTVANTAAVANSLTVNANDIQLNSTINFMGVGTQVTGNAAVMARTVDALFTGGASLTFITGLLNVPTTGEYARALQSLAPVADSRGVTSTLTSSSTFANQMLSCRVPGEGDAYAVIREGQCVWARVTGRRGETGSSDAGPGVSSSSYMISTGAQFNLGGAWRAGGGIAYEEASSNSAFARSEAQRAHLGGVVKYNPGPWLFALGLNGGFGNSDNTRFASFGGFNATARSSIDTDYIAGRFTTAYLMPLGGFYLKPQMDLTQTYLNRGGYTETATGGIGLNVDGSSLSVWSYAPSLEFGMQTRLANNSILRPYAKIGGTWQDKGQVSTTAAFNGFAGSSFTMTSSMDRAFLDLGGGFDVIGSDGAVLRLQLDGQYGETTTSHSGSAKFSLKF